MRKTIILIACGYGLVGHAQPLFGLKGNWVFSGTPDDASGQNHHGTPVGNVTLVADRDGNSACAYAFPGDSSHVAIPFHSDFDIAPIGQYSVSLWYQGGTLNGGDLEWLFRKRTTAVGFHTSDYALALYDNNRALVLTGNNEALWTSAMPPMPDAVWHHFVSVYSGGTQQAWLDNVQLSTTSPSFITQSAEGIAIGEFFEGRIDDVRFYDVALNPTDVYALFVETSACAATAIVDGDSAPITVWPIPATNSLTIGLPPGADQGNAWIEIMDATGRVIDRDPLRAGSTSIDVSALTSGTYLLQLHAGPATYIQRFIKE
jgi:Concanavalin A-like lectin/glucanases superfamily/Secretion system C-terminal sorting domain